MHTNLYTTKPALKPETHFAQRFDSKPELPKALPDMVSLKQVRFGAKKDPADLMLDSEDKIIEALNGFIDAMETYKQHAKKGHNLEKKLNTLDSVTTILQDGLKAKEPLTFWKRQGEKAIGVFQRAGTAIKDDLVPYWTTLGRDMEKMQGLLDKHEEVVANLDQYYEALRQLDVLNNDQIAQYKRRRAALQTERQKLAAQLDGKALLFALGNSLTTFTAGVDVATERVKGTHRAVFHPIKTLRSEEGAWNSHEIDAGTTLAKDSAAKAKKQWAMAFKSLGTDISTQYVQLVRDLIAAPADIAYATRQTINFTGKQAERLQALRSKLSKVKVDSK